MAHMVRMVISHLWVMREERNLNRAREKKFKNAPQEPIEAMRRKGEHVICMLVRGWGKGWSSLFSCASAPMHGYGIQ